MRALLRSNAEEEVVLASVDDDEGVDDEGKEAESLSASDGAFVSDDFEVEEVSSFSEAPVFPLVSLPPVLELPALATPLLLVDTSRLLFPFKT